jgi:[ribosomal protein S5]-alanine N-acetyltransferase
MILETARLALRPVTPADHAGLHGLFTQPGVRRFVFDDQIITSEHTEAIVGKSEDLFRTAQYGLWLARPRSEAAATTPLIGFGAFWHFRDPPELELLYGVADAHVKQRYGREIAHAVVEYGFTTLGMREIRASTDAAHAMSRRLLDALGFTFERQAVVGGLDTAFYSLRNSRVLTGPDPAGM